MIAGKMASACVNNISVTPENFLDCPAPRSSFAWLSPRVSKSSKSPEKKSNLESPAGDFEFRLDDPAVMLPADELFSDGKLLPLMFKPPEKVVSEEVRSPETVKSCRRTVRELNFSNDPYLFSPKAPRCSSRWRELLGLKKLSKQENQPKTTSSPSSSSPSTKSIRLFLYNRGSNKTTSSSSSDNHSLSLPLLNNRLSLSSSSSFSDETLPPRLSLDAPNTNPTRPRPLHPTRPTRRTQPDPTRMVRGVSVDSPRMNSSGRVLFQSLERSSSSPSSLNGGRPNRPSYRGIMERSKSANVVRVSPVLNVPVCSLRGSGVFGFGQLFSQSSSQKKETGNNGGSRNKETPS